VARSFVAARAGQGVDRRRVAAQLHFELTGLRDDIVAEAEQTMSEWRPRIRRVSYLPSALNLAHYLALRHHDLRRLQLALMPLGLSSLGRCEARVLENLDAVLAALAVMADREAPDQVDMRAFFRGHELLADQAAQVLGPAPPGRGVRIMVTLSEEGARDPSWVAHLVSAGMNVARINCAHDDPDIWAAISANVRRAARMAERPCRICFDLEGPRARIRSTTVDRRQRLRVGDELLMTSRPVPVPADRPWQFECSLPGILDDLAPGAAVRIDEGRLGSRVVRRVPQGLLLVVDSAPAGGAHLRVEKGLNFPATELRVDSLTAKDLSDLDAVVTHADLVGLSFVQRPRDIAAVQDALAERGAASHGLVIKVETELAVRSLPSLIVEGAGRQPLGVMIARGDLAVEIGHLRLAEIQEELLWLCEAAQVPVIWATQVLDNLVKKGIRHRGEMTDAAMAERAECVMLNKGPFAIEAVQLLASLLARMEGHQFKKTSRMRALHAWGDA
jgi:pyruvate kinase